MPSPAGLLPGLGKHKAIVGSQNNDVARYYQLGCIMEGGEVVIVVPLKRLLLDSLFSVSSDFVLILIISSWSEAEVQLELSETVASTIPSMMASQDQATLSKVATFLDAGRELFANPKNQEVVAFVHDIIQKNQELEADLMAQHRLNANLTSKHNQEKATLTSKLDQEKAKSKDDRNALSSKLQGAQEDLRRTKDKMNSQISKLEQDLTAAMDKLQRLQAYSEELTPVSRVIGDMYVLFFFRIAPLSHTLPLFSL
jgi:nitrogen fixation/metabolism regulation signal transduction histidine kinase